MIRRLLPLMLVLGVTALAVAIAPWTVSTSALVARIDGQLDAFGLDLEVRGRSTIALLPVPRVKLEEFTLTNAAGAAVVRGGVLRGELKTLPLLLGRLELAEVSLAEATIDAQGDTEGPHPWQGTIDLLRGAVESGRFAGRSQVRRVALTRSNVTLRDARDGGSVRLEDVNLVMGWASPDSPLDIGGSLRWRGEFVTLAVADLNPHAIAAGRSSPVSARLVGPGARLVVVGTAQGGGGLRVAGQSNLELKSARDFARWSDVGLPLAPSMDSLALDGSFELNGEAVSWRDVRLTLGADVLDGALMARVERGRLALNGTLAADRLDLSPFTAPLLQAQTASGPWSEEELHLEGQTRADLDLRLSANAARAGALRLEDVALSLLVRANRIEASLGRATLNRGTLRGRLALAAAPGGVDARTQATFERLDLAGLMGDLRAGRWLVGSAGGQIALEGVGGSPAEIVRALHGRAALTIRGGELVGFGVGDALRRMERRPLSASLDWRSGRTPFDQAVLQLNVANGAATVAESGLSGPSVRGTVQGRLALPERTLAVRALFETLPTPAGQPGAALAFDLAGPWSDVSIMPDARAVIERSGAARSLLPDLRVQTGEPSRVRESAAQ